MTKMQFPISLLIISLLSGCGGLSDLTINPKASEDTEKVEFIEEYPEQDQATLFSKVTKAMALVFKSSKSVIEMQDRESGEIVGNGYAEFITTCKLKMRDNLPVAVSYQIMISVRDNKVRYRYVPRIERIGDMERGRHALWNDADYEYMGSTQCFWDKASPYFAEVQARLHKFVSEEDEF